MKIVILDGYTVNHGDLSWDGLKEFGELTVYDRTPKDSEIITSRIGDAEAVLENKVNMSREIMERCPNLKYIGELATGYNNIDIAAAKEKEIVVSNIPAYSTPSVAQLAIALLLEICHHTAHHNDLVHQGKWTSCPDSMFYDHAYPLIELSGKTMGIIGFGQIGQSVARIARALGMNVLAYSRSIREEGKALADYVSLDELLAKSDVISLHCPLFPETKGIINAKNIAKMKDGVIILNTSRGPLINEADLAEALRNGKVYAAGVDVVSEEPMRSDNPLLGAPNCFITPHMAWMPTEARLRLIDIAVNNVRAFVNGSPINNVAG
ncbi:MAG: D-2-hydroxyacid dehydrogenase [Anaerolineaceae bacterium]|nr:D-2-hydroxyacid dehydrogenase [Anaerolineaceae bacterium]